MGGARSQRGAARYDGPHLGEFVSVVERECGIWREMGCMYVFSAKSRLKMGMDNIPERNCDERDSKILRVLIHGSFYVGRYGAGAF